MKEDLYAYHIYKPTVFDAGFFILHSSDLPRSGFRSLYALTQEAANTLKTAGTQAGYRGSVWSRQLWLDIDDASKVTAVTNRLEAKGLGYIVYSSGSKGYHIGIERLAEPNHLLPQMDKMWVKSNIPEADTSIYHHVAMFRLEGTIHDKTGNPKEFVREHPGNALSYDFKMEKVKFDQESEAPNKSVFDDNITMMLTTPCDEGERHERLLNLGLRLKALNEPIDFISRWLYHTNLLFTQPKPVEEINNIVRFLQQVRNNE